jgi:hypothetical protein
VEPFPLHFIVQFTPSPTTAYLFCYYVLYFPFVFSLYL